MAQKVTIAFLEAVILRINKSLNRPEVPYTRVNGVMTPNAGCFVLNQENGGFNLGEIVDTSGAEHTFFYSKTKSELNLQLQAFLQGINYKL